MPQTNKNECESRIDALLSAMTLEQKVGQLHQLPAREDDLARLETLIREGKLGSLILASTAYAGNEVQRTARLEQLNHLQRVAVEQSPHHIPLLFGRDIIHGCRTIFPIPLGLAATFNPATVEAAAAVAAAEGRAIGAQWTFAPMVDIARDPRWGRIAEGFGEDPWLCACMAQASVRGFQGDDPAQPDRLLACAKHFVAYGAAEAGRDYNTAECTDSTLLNTYCISFRGAIEAGVASVMSSFNELGGEPVTGSRRLLDTILRQTLGFTGLLVTDWGAIQQMMHHGTAASRSECAKFAIEAGNDIDMASDCYIQHLADLVRAGTIDVRLIDESVRRVLRAKLSAGLFERPYTDPATAGRVFLTPAHRQLAHRAAIESIVLLKNAGHTLPLDRKIKTLAVIGPMCDEQQSHLGTWHGEGMATDVIPIAAALRQRLPGTNVRTCPHLSDVMLAHVTSADAVVLCLGENVCRSGEDNSVTSLDLPPGQSALLEAVAELGKPLIAVICAGRPLVIPHVLRRADAVVWAWHLGVEAGNAIADILIGNANPGGKMPVTLPRSIGQVPLYYNRKRTGRPHSKQHGDIVNEPLLPFGFGLSYTQFAISDLRLASTKVAMGQPVNISVQITNTGTTAGDEVVQCYIQDRVAQVTRPVRELKAFQRVHLAPGQTQQISFTLTDRQLGYYGLNGRWRVDPGTFTLWVGNSSTATLSAEFELF